MITNIKDLKLNYLYNIKDQNSEYIMEVTNIYPTEQIIKGDLIKIIKSSTSEFDFITISEIPEFKKNFFTFGFDIISKVPLSNPNFNNMCYEFNELGKPEDFPEYFI